jgi:hypothetical protein
MANRLKTTVILDGYLAHYGTSGPIRKTWSVANNKLEWQDDAGNVLMSLADSGTTGLLTVTGDLAVLGGDLTSTASTFNLLNTTSTTINFGALATALTAGADGSGWTKVRNAFVTSKIVTFSANDTTPSVAGANIFKVPGTWTAANNITAFDDGTAGQTITIIGGDSDCVVVDGAALVIAGNWTAAANATLRLVYDGTNWYEISRAAN